MNKLFLLFICSCFIIGGCSYNPKSTTISKKLLSRYEISSGIIYTTGQIVYQEAFIKDPDINNKDLGKIQDTDVYTYSGYACRYNLALVERNGYICQNVRGYSHIYTIPSLRIQINAYAEATPADNISSDKSIIEPIIELSGNKVFDAQDLSIGLGNKKFIEKKEFLPGETKDSIVKKNISHQLSNSGYDNNISYYLLIDKHSGGYYRYYFKDGEKYYYLLYTNGDCNSGSCRELIHKVTYFTS